ncbi:MAG: thiamine biosynthesis lipoprotein [Oceanicoccus sp.]|jgi:thiamine biosynthesis lipoprotein
MKKIQETKTYLGTPITIEVVAYDKDKAERAIERAFAQAARIEESYSRFIDDNELSALNAHLGEWTEINSEFLALISFGVRVGEKTNGAFDLSVKSVLEGWGYDADYSLQEKAAGQCGQIEIKDGKIRCSAEIELGGLGKGYAIDRMVNELADFSNVMVNAGGDLFARGQDKDGPWKVALEHPNNEKQAIGTVEVDKFSVCASSPLRRHWRDKHHLVNPRENKPADQMLAVYTQADAALIADAYSTALFALGFEAAVKILPELPVEALLIGPEGQGWKSDGFIGELFQS